MMIVLNISYAAILEPLFIAFEGTRTATATANADPTDAPAPPPPRTAPIAADVRGRRRPARTQPSRT